MPYDQADSFDEEGDDIGNATAMTAASTILGALDYDGDIDYFRFQAERGQSYQIDITPGTLDDPIATLYDVYGSLLDSNDDHGDTYASRLHFEASSSGEHFVAVEGYGTGTYTLTVSPPPGSTIMRTRPKTARAWPRTGPPWSPSTTPRKA